MKLAVLPARVPVITKLPARVSPDLFNGVYERAVVMSLVESEKLADTAGIVFPVLST